MSAGSSHFDFERAPELPGADRLAQAFTSANRRLTRLLWDFTIEGVENVPAEGPAVITPNHLSFCDSVFVPAALPRRVWAIGKGEYMDDWKTKHLFPALGMIPVDRSGGDAAQAALDTAAKVLEGGHLFMIYPEGTRSRSGFLHKGRTGAARLAIRCNAPIVPVGHMGTLDVQPPDSVTMKIRRPVTVRFGAPMWAHDFGNPDDPRTWRSFTDAVMYEIAQLSEQQYVDVYASKDDEPGKPASVEQPGSPDTEQPRMTPRRPSVVGDAPRAPGGRPTAPSRPAARTVGASVPVGAGPISIPLGRAASATPTPTPVAGD